MHRCHSLTMKLPLECLSSFMFLKDFNDLKGRVTHTHRSFVFQFIPQMATKAGAGLEHSQEPEASSGSPTWV